ncbi:hypothetical protein C8R48DRAFT_673451 [Suillus tomentosus]|nr:hypothetical protein C8R48DRAFT_673451 [Suillus tomentosus]
MAPVATPTTDFITAPNTVYDITAQDVRNLIWTITILEYKPRGSVIVVKLTEHEDHMATASWLTNGVTPRPDVESGKLQIRGSIVFVSYFNNAEATSSSFVEGGWYLSLDGVIIENGVMRLSGRIRTPSSFMNVKRIMHSFLAVTPYRAPGQEFTHRYLLANFRPRLSRCLQKLFATHRALRDICVKMITLPPCLFKQCQLAKHIACAEELFNGKALAKIYVGIFDLAKRGVSASYSFFELSRTSIDVHRLRREGEAHFDLPEISTMQIVKHPFISNLANYVNALPSKDSQTEEYDWNTHLRGP